ncbi:acyl-protein synthetase [Halalkalibacter sp. APA_J-10(15)]|uniref:LuxE/PaaK family acyltransferase n=1 Tax=Halalkalibacter sp. APA_J-10(15) TaxID=2933805 RepID=UPI001FF14E06|nr:acyl-protein synthetase [Halalkalibacter sp. APA_J-10(15)]MCK0472949.1 acyl-protein synthetase [Halalkalibacter sp. APA_J-10(15)]
MGTHKEPFMLRANVKQGVLLKELNKRTQDHLQQCLPYRNMIHHMSVFPCDHLNELPFLPVQVFKMLDLYSVPKESIVKTLTSSGTTGQQVSKIFLDKDTSVKQTRALASIMTSLLGKKRVPMIIIDSKSVIKNRQAFSARGAGIVGFSNFGRKHFYLLDEEMNIDWDGLEAFLREHKGEQIFLFGFTFIVWQYFLQACQKYNRSIDLSKGVLVHGGGWKKLKEEAVSNEQFKEALFNQFGLKRVHNYYGMVEQVGSIFIECEYGHFHTPDFADIIVRDSLTYEALPVGKQGLLQVVSTLPKSYPGHSLLTEDVGVLLGEDTCSCGRLGKFFQIEGRLPKAEVRGCSDTVAYDQKGARG